MIIRYASLMCLSIAVVLAQDPYGRIIGRIVDSGGAVVPAASIRVTNIATNVVTNAGSDSQGNYEARNLIPGHYKLAVAMQGFKGYERGPIEVRVDDVLTVDVALQLGVLSEKVTVTAEGPLLEAANPNVGQVIDNRRLEDLPMPGSSALYLVEMAPGIVSATSPIAPWQNNSPQGSSNFVVNGSPVATSQFMVDGAPNMLYYGTVSFQPPPELLQEVRVQTAPFDASLGHFLGAQINMVTKSGTNTLHGTLTYQYNGRTLNAHAFFINRQIYDPTTGPVTQAKINSIVPPTRMNRYRATATGPVYIPKLYNGHNRTFFTYSIDDFHRAFVSSVSQNTVPTLAERSGDFSALLALGSKYQIYDPATIAAAPNGRTNRQPLPGNIIPASRIDPVARRALQYYPPPNVAGTADGLNNYTATNMNQPNNQHHFARLDEVLSPNHRLFVSGAHFSGGGAYNAQMGQWDFPFFGENPKEQGLDAKVSEVLVLRPDLVLEMNYGLSRFWNPSLAGSLGFDLKSLGLPSSLVDQLDGSLTTFPALNINGFTTIGRNSGRTIEYTHHYLAGNVAHSRGNHSLRFGGEFRVNQEDRDTYGFVSPSYTFGTAWTVGPQDTSPAAPVGQGLASFLLGLPTAGSHASNASMATQAEYLAVFLQDDWKLSRKLTINLGLRYELELPTTERYNRANRGFDFSTVNPIQAQAQSNLAKNPVAGVSNLQTIGGLLFAGVNGAPRELWQMNTRTFAPRVGLAYRLREKTVLRAGYGIFFASKDTASSTATDVVFQQGFSQTTNMVPSLDNGLTFHSTLDNPFPDGLLVPVGASLGLKTYLGNSVSLVWPARPQGYVQRWSFDLQQELPNRVLVDVGYVGNRGTGLGMAQDLNPIPAQYLSRLPTRDTATINYLNAAVPNPFNGIPEFAGSTLQGTTVARSQLLLPYPQFAGVNTTWNAGFSWYHSLQMKAEKRFSRGFTLQATYTWSKFMDATAKLNPTDAFPTHVIADLDRPQNLAVSGMYELPVGKGKRFLSGAPGWVNQSLGGWSVQAIYQAQSGPPIGFGDIIFNGNLSDIVLPPSQRTLARWFNTDAGFERGVAQLAQNIRTFPLRLTGLRAPGINCWHVSLFKAFRIGERMHFQLRAEGQDALNHPLFSAPNTNPNNTLFGQISNTTVAAQRTITLGARMSW